MKIEGAELREIRLRLREPFRISSGVWQERRVLLLTLHSGGFEGWGECVAAEDPSYSYETTDTAWHILTDFILPRVSGFDSDSDSDPGLGPDSILESVDWIRGHSMAKATVEMAAWDLRAKIDGRSLADSLGGVEKSIPVGVSIGLQDSDDALLAKVERYLGEGYRRIKIKIKPGRDVEMLRRVRDRFGDVPMMADANSAYSIEDLSALLEMDDLGLMMIEQPLPHDDYLDHARLQEQLRTPICLDESIRSLRDARLALKLNSCRIINIKPGRVGGLGVSRRIHDLCRDRGTPVWCGGMLESGVGRAHNLALATLPGFSLPGDISGSRRYWDEDIVTPEFEPIDGLMPVPEGAGIGVEIRKEKIDALTQRTQAFR